MFEIIRCNGADDLAAATIERLVAPRIAISGGSTYAALYPYWARVPQLADVVFYPVDERVVPLDDPASNWGAARRLLFEPLGNKRSVEHFASSANAYEALLRHDLGEQPQFDAVFLGIGDDGHTASLFVGGTELNNVSDIVLETISPEAPTQRVTLGLSVLWSARELFAVVSGERKRSIVERGLAGDRTLPATRALDGHPAAKLILERSADPTIH